MEGSADYERKILEAVSEEEHVEPDKTLVLSSGVVLEYQRVPVLRIQNLLRQFKYPDVPELWDEVREQKIKNPSHPVYVSMCEQVDMDRTLAVLDAIIAFGTTPITIPDTVEPVDSEGWVTDCKEFFGIDLTGVSVRARYLAWVKYVAIIDTNDFQKISLAFNLAMGVSESRVAEALQDRFPNH